MQSDVPQNLCSFRATAVHTGVFPPDGLPGCLFVLDVLYMQPENAQFADEIAPLGPELLDRLLYLEIIVGIKLWPEMVPNHVLMYFDD